MKVTLTGSTGFIGSHILTELQEHGHEVIALVRDDAQADRVAAIGATPAVVDLYDRPALTSKSAAQTAPFTPPVPWTLPARTLTLRWSTRRPTLSRAPASPIST
jgi:NAD(P)-dependent dehydrogenase (short-subunit alcohol dehydrogenase family)